MANIPDGNVVYDRVIEHVYANGKYDVQIYIMELATDAYDPNSSDSPKVRYKLGISPVGIINFTIKETLADWVTSAEITIQGSLEDVFAQINSTIPQNQNIKLFNNNGNDLLYVRIIPTQAEYKLGGNINDWKLEYTFAITDIVDIESPVGLEGNQSNQNTKCKKLSLVDYKYHCLKTKSLLYSSYSVYEDGNPPPEYGIKETGDIIRDIFRLTGFGDALPPLPAAASGNDPNIKWDIGSSKMFYTIPSEEKALNALNYVYAHHSGSTSSEIDFNSGELKSTLNAGAGGKAQVFDFCILHNERTDNAINIDVTSGAQSMYVGKLSLIPMTTYFQKAGSTANTPGDLQIEHFFVADDVVAIPSDGSVPQVGLEPTRAPLNKTSTPNSNVDLKLKGYAEINKYTLLDMSADTNNTLFKSTPIISVNTQTGEYKMELLENRIETARRFIAQNYIQNLYRGHGSQSSNNEDYFLTKLDKTKGLYNINPVFCLYGALDENPVRQSYGVQTLLKMGIFLNQGINFRVPGLTYRTSGKFIGIDKEQGANKTSDYDNKFLGQYFVIDVKHIFEGTAYYNDITAVKIHSFYPQPPSLNGSI